MKLMLVATLIAAVTMPTVSPENTEPAESERCTFEREIERTVPGGQAALLYVDAGSGDLTIEGRADIEDIVVRAHICASHEEFLDVLDVTTDRTRDDVALRTHYPAQTTERNSWGDRTASIDLVVLVPLGTDVEIDDSSGSVTLQGTGSVTIDDSSGSLEIRDVEGDVTIEDTSGGIEVRGVRGGVLLRDGSGGIEIADVSKSVRVVSDGSGSIRVDGVGGDFIVGDDGSGSIRYSAVEGSVQVPQPRKRRRGL